MTLSAAEWQAGQTLPFVEDPAILMAGKGEGRVGVITLLDCYPSTESVFALRSS